MVAIGGGGFLPARILRTTLQIPIYTVSLELYNESLNVPQEEVMCRQWVDSDVVTGKKVLVVDEVDDTRRTLAFCLQELTTQGCPKAVAVAVVHNKLKHKRASLPEDVLYFAAAEVPDQWNCYPWDAEKYGHSIAQHEAIALQCSGQRSKLWPPWDWVLLGFLAGALSCGVLVRR